MNARMERLGITPQLLLEVFDIPVSFHRCLVPITGGVTSALMLSQAIWTSQSLEPSADGWLSRASVNVHPGGHGASGIVHPLGQANDPVWPGVGPRN